MFNSSRIGTLTKASALGSFLIVILTACSGGSENEDTSPSQFSVDATYTSKLSEPTISDEITVTGVNASTSISISNGEYQINGGEWGSSTGSVSINDVVRVKLTSPDTYISRNVDGEPIDSFSEAIVTIGGVSADYRVYAAQYSESDITPESLENQELDEVIPGDVISTSEIIVSGVDIPVWVVIEEGLISVNGNSFQSGLVEVEEGDSVAFQVSARDEYESTNGVAFKIGSQFGLIRYTTFAESDMPGFVVIKSNCHQGYCFEYRATRVNVWAINGEDADSEYYLPEDGTDLRIPVELGETISFTVYELAEGEELITSYVSVPEGQYRPFRARLPITDPSLCKNLTLKLANSLGSIFRLSSEAFTFFDAPNKILSTSIAGDEAELLIATCLSDELVVRNYSREVDSSGRSFDKLVGYSSVNVADLQEGDTRTADLAVPLSLELNLNEYVNEVVVNSQSLERPAYQIESYSNVNLVSEPNNEFNISALNLPEAANWISASSGEGSLPERFVRTVHQQVDNTVTKIYAELMPLSVEIDTTEGNFDGSRIDYILTGGTPDFIELSIHTYHEVLSGFEASHHLIFAPYNGGVVEVPDAHGLHLETDTEVTLELNAIDFPGIDGYEQAISKPVVEVERYFEASDAVTFDYR